MLVRNISIISNWCFMILVTYILGLTEYITTNYRFRHYSVTNENNLCGMYLPGVKVLKQQIPRVPSENLWTSCLWQKYHNWSKETQTMCQQHSCCSGIEGWNHLKQSLSKKQIVHNISNAPFQNISNLPPSILTSFHYFNNQGSRQTRKTVLFLEDKHRNGLIFLLYFT